MLDNNNNIQYMIVDDKFIAKNMVQLLLCMLYLEKNDHINDKPIVWQEKQLLLKITF